MNWKTAKFKDKIQYKSGYTWTKEQETNYPEEKTVRVLTVTNIQSELDLTSELYLKDVRESDKIAKSVSENWSIAVSSNGNRKRIGNAVFIKDNTDYLFASFLTAFKPKEDSQIIPEYFFRWLSSHKIQERITSVSEGTTGLGNLDIRYLRNMEIDYPEDIKEQTAIASILSKVDEAILATQNSIKAAEKLKKALMQNLLTGKLKPDGSWRTEDELISTKYGYAAKEWKYCKIQDLLREGYILKVQDGNHGESHPVSSEFVKEGIPFVMASDISKGYIDTENCNFITKERADRLRIGFSYKNDVLFSHKASIGYTCIVESTDPYIMLTPQVTLYRPNIEKIIPEYLLYFFQMYSFKMIVEGLAKQSTRNYIGITNQKKMWIYLPDDINDQKDIIEPIRKVDLEIISKQKKISTFQRLKKSLMQNLLTGKVRVDVEKILELCREK